jgi:site-specific DNA recombinase
MVEKVQPETAAVYGRQSRGKEKSIGEQVELCTVDAEAEGLRVVATYTDATSASRYRRKDRATWPRVLAAVRAHEFDVLVLWISSRGDRDLTSWSSLLDAARDAGVLIRVVADERTYDVRRPADWKVLADQGVSNAVDSDKISQGVRRGQAGSAKGGRPAHGRAPYGYRRTYDPATGALVGQEIDPAPAAIVREIIGRLAKGEAVSTITSDLNTRGVPTVGAQRWYRERVRDLSRNVAYIGQRQHNGQAYPGDWPPLVESATFWAAQRVLSDPARTTTRPGRQRHLLSYLGRCEPCGSPLSVVRGRYRCLDHGCVTIVQDDTDAYVTAIILGVASKPEVYARLRRSHELADAEAVAAQAEVDKLTAELDGWRKSAAASKTTPETMAVVEPSLTARIQAAQRRADAASVPPALRVLLGGPEADVRARWEGMPLPARRDAIRALATVRVVRAVVPGGRGFDPARVVVEPVD